VIATARTVLAVPTGPTVLEREPPPLIIEDHSNHGLPTQLLDDWDDAGGSGSGDGHKSRHIVDGSGGGHINEDLYGVSDGGQVPQRLPKDRQDEPANLDHGDSPNEAEINQLATRLRKQTLTSETGLDAYDARPSGSGSGSVDLACDSTAAQLSKQLFSIQGCTSDAHDAHEHEHTQLHTENGACNSFSDLLRLQTPSDSILDVLIEPKFIEASSES
jgi:hypothetical protein